MGKGSVAPEQVLAFPTVRMSEALLLSKHMILAGLFFSPRFFFFLELGVVVHTFNLNTQEAEGIEPQNNACINKNKSLTTVRQGL